MTISRRLFLGATIGVLAAPAIGWAASPVITETPFLPIQQGPDARLMTLIWKPLPPQPLAPYEIAAFYHGTAKTPRMRVEVRKITPSPTDMVWDAVEAEERIFAGAHDRYDARATMTEHLGAPHDPLNFVVVSNCNVMAVRNRRAPGNVVGMHPSLADRLTLMVRQEESVVGRWRRIGALNHSINIYVSDHMPRDRFVCATNGFYWNSRGTHDGAGVLLEHDGSRFLLSPGKERLDDGYETQHSVDNYATLVRI